MKRSAIVSSFLTSAFCLLPSAFAQVPTRDTPAQMRVPATGVIRGQVVSDEAQPQPIRKAVVTLTGDVAAARGAVTDDNGMFSFTALPAGRFTVSARKPAYLPTAYGATRPGRPGTPIPLAAGQQTTIAIRMARGAVVTGTIRDQFGRPAPGVPVQVDPARKTPSPVPAAGRGTTDDRGQYRVFGLPPGEYVVSARPTVRGNGPIGMRTTAEVDALFAEIVRRGAAPGAGTPEPLSQRREPPIPPPPVVGYVPVYFPGTFLASDAAPIRLSAAEERAGLDFTIQPAGTSRIEGTISGPVANLAAVQLTIGQVGQQGLSSLNTNPVLTKRPGPDGAFEYSSVPPGRYTIMARADPSLSGAPPPSPLGQVMVGGGGPIGPGSGAGRPDYLYAMAEVDARGDDVSLSLLLQPGNTVTGRVRFDGTSDSARIDPARVTVTISPMTPVRMMQSGTTVIGNPFSGAPPMTVAPDGTFSARAVAPGAYQVRATLPPGTPGDWWLRSVTVGGRDVLDRPLEIRSGEPLGEVLVTFSDRHSVISGVLQATTGAPAPEYFVIAFPADPSERVPRSRRIKSTRPGTDGRFALRDLPAGTYLLAALTDLEPADLDDPGFLEQVAPAALRVTLADGEQKTQDLRIAR